MKTKIFICIGALFCVAATIQQVGWPKAKLTVRVLDEQGQPVRGAKVKIGFREKLTDRDERATGETDANGEYTAEGYSDKRLLSGASKLGYYDSSSPGTIFNEAVLGKWQPWNPVEELVLRPIGNPVAMTVKRVSEDIPVLDQPCGFDLEESDWVTPYGRGVKSDIIFKVLRDYRDRSNFSAEAELTFAHPLDGLLPMKAPSYARTSAFRWERSAPEAGYRSPHAIRFVSRDLRNHVNREKSFVTAGERETGYFIRVRTSQEKGRIIAANYGKITGDIGIDPRDSKTCLIVFTYYFNPVSLDQNIEWSPERNLLQGLRREEAPTEP